MNVHLPMYDLPELRSATETLCQAVARELGADLGGDGALALGQVCGYPFARGTRGDLRYVATPCYSAPGCQGATYRSLIVVRKDEPAEELVDLRGRVCARNEPGSHSGDNALRHAVCRLAQGGVFFQTVIDTGSHANSLGLIQQRQADVAAIDCVTWALLQAHRSAATHGLRILATTPPAPAPPYVTQLEPAAIRSALRAALEAPATANARRALLLDDVEDRGVGAYQCLLDLEGEAVAAGFANLG